MTNSELKAQIDSQITNETTDYAITPTDVGTNMKAVVDYADQQSSIIAVYDALSAQSTSETTTSIMNYGVNIFSTVTNANYATKLPQPTTGKSLKVINNGEHGLSIFPSNVGGWIGNLPIDAPTIIPNNGNMYEFYCIENPLPGGWATNNKVSANTLDFAEIVVSHTNGVETNKVGITTANLVASAGLGLDGNGNILFTGEWRSEDTVATISSVTCRSNVLDADLFDASGASRIAVSILTAYKTASNSTTNGDRHSISFLKPGFYQGLKAPIGTLNSPVLIGDTDTLYDTKLADQALIDEQIGIGGTFSRYYYTFALNIPASAATKTYRFKWSIIYS